MSRSNRNPYNNNYGNSSGSYSSNQGNSYGSYGTNRGSSYDSYNSQFADTRHRRQGEFSARNYDYKGPGHLYDEAHEDIYGEAEGIDHGQHPTDPPRYPDGSSRAKAHRDYKTLQVSADRAENAYTRDHKAAKVEYQRFPEPRKDFYNANTDSLAPHQHAQLSPVARDFQQKAGKHADDRRGFLDDYPFGLHSRRDQHTHVYETQVAYNQRGRADGHVQRHERYQGMEDPYMKKVDSWDRY